MEPTKLGWAFFFGGIDVEIQMGRASMWKSKRKIRKNPFLKCQRMRNQHKISTQVFEWRLICVGRSPSLMESCQICQMYLGIIWHLYSPRRTAKFGEALQSWKMMVAVLRNHWVLIWGEASRAICLSDNDAQCLLQPGLAGCCFAKISNNFRTTEVCLWCVLTSVNQEESQLKTYADVVGFSSVFCYAIVIPLCLLYLYGKQHIVLRASRTTTVAWQHIQ